MGEVISNSVVSSAWPRSHCSLAGGGEQRLGGWVAQAHQGLLRALRGGAVALAQRFAEGGKAEVRFALGAVEAVQKRGDVDQLRSRVHEVEIEELLAGHHRRTKSERRLCDKRPREVWRWKTSV